MMPREAPSTTTTTSRRGAGDAAGRFRFGPARASSAMTLVWPRTGGLARSRACPLRRCLIAHVPSPHPVHRYYARASTILKHSAVQPPQEAAVMAGPAERRGGPRALPGWAVAAASDPLLDAGRWRRLALDSSGGGAGAGPPDAAGGGGADAG